MRQKCSSAWESHNERTLSNQNVTSMSKDRQAFTHLRVTVDNFVQQNIN